MYRELTAADHRKNLNLPSNYNVAGFLSFGSWNEKEYLPLICSAFQDLGGSYAEATLPGFLGRIKEITVGSNRYWVTVAYGGAMLSEYLHLACLFGSRKNIHLGSCGGLKSGMEGMDLLVPSWSFGDDSITRSYAKAEQGNKHYPDKELSDRLLKESGAVAKAWSGPVMTTQAMLAETREELAGFSEQGFYGIEMETATVFSVSRHFSVPSAALLLVADNLSTNKTVYDDSFRGQQKERRKLTAKINQITARELAA